jgi:hypothetical protein
MTLTDKLNSIKGKYHKCMVENVTMLLSGLLTSKTTNLYKMKDDMSRITGIQGLKSGSYYQRLIRFFERYSTTRLFLDLLLWALTTVIKDVDNFFWTVQNGKLVLLNYTF